MLGQVWSQTGNQALTDLIKAERDLFKIGGDKDTKVSILFSALPLEYGEKMVDLGLNQGLSTPDDFGSGSDSEIILSLWENSAVLTKTAQQLYLHRNSLNTRLINGKN